MAIKMKTMLAAFTMFVALLVAGISAVPSVAYASSESVDTYMDIDLSDATKVNEDGTTNGKASKILSGGVTVLRSLVNKLLLPISLIVVIGRLIYVAIFPVMLGRDPLGITQRRKKKNAKGEDKRGSMFGMMSAGYFIDDTDYAYISGEGRLILYNELSWTFRAILIVLSVWGALNFVIWGTGWVLNALGVNQFVGM